MDDWDDSASMRLAGLALDRGRPTDDLVTALAVRGTLLVDLALRGRVVETDDAVEVDDAPTGFPPADRLFSGWAPSLTEVLRHGRVDQEDLAAEHLRRGSWRVRRRWPRRFADLRAERTAADEGALQTPDRDWTPADASLAAIAGTLGLLRTPRELPDDELLAHAGPVRWVVELVVEEVDRAITRGRFMRGAVSFADGTPG